MMDLIIKGGHICDGSGSPPFTGDIAVKDGRIVGVGRLSSSKARRIISAEDSIIAPGFIDIHSHTDENILINPCALSKIHQGITTEIVGNCGVSPAPLHGEFKKEYADDLKSRFDLPTTWESCEDFFSLLGEKGLGINYCMLVGNGNIRGGVVGFKDRPAHDDERAAMLTTLSESLNAGAWGLSSGLIYVPSCFSDAEELKMLAGRVARYGGIYATHMRGEGDRLLEAISEAVEVAQCSGASLQISHLKASGQRNWGKIDQALSLIDESRSRGIECGCDQYPYTASSTGLNSIMPQWAREGGKEAFLRKLRDPSIRKRIREEMTDPPNWSLVVLSSARKKNGRFLGMNIEEFAEAMGKSPLDAALDLLLEEEDEVAALFFAQSEENVERVMKLPFTAIGTDAAARAPSGPLSADLPHPRAYGTFPRVLGHYVREKGILRVEEAVRKMTSLPAHKLGFRDRGVICCGYWADITIFDPDDIREKSTYLNPHHYPEGIEYVIVNGQAVVEKGEHTGSLPGRVLRRGRKEG
jgi:N-acyl-D-amino-acid deacylase